MSPRDWRLFIEDMLEAIAKINRYIGGMNFEILCQDERTIDAVVRNLEIIGEAARRIPDPVKAESQEIDWKAINGLRNRIVHEYFGPSLSIIGKSAKVTCQSSKCYCVNVSATPATNNVGCAKPLLPASGISFCYAYSTT